ncbi:MAG: outer membrane lipoprotein-sorting protein [Pseudomonadota bacterium]
MKIVKYILATSLLISSIFASAAEQEANTLAENNMAKGTDQEANEWVKIVDSYRQFSESIKVTTRIQVINNGEKEKEKLYEVYIKPGRKSLVVFKSSGENGQKVLMLDNMFWLLMPKSPRPIRITPLQKLLGDATTGDIATMSWHEDYDAVKESPVEIDGVKVDSVMLTAKVQGVSYKSIRLFLARESHKPLKAEFYVSSGKLAKYASFVIHNTGKREQIIKMELTDAIQKGRVTLVEYLSNESYSIDDKYYNPQFLANDITLKID